MWQVGDYVAVGTEWGRVRSMRSAAGRIIKEALPGQPAEVTGLRGVPQAGDDLMVLPRSVTAAHQPHILLVVVSLKGLAAVAF